MTPEHYTHTIVANPDADARGIWLPNTEQILIDAFRAAEAEQSADQAGYVRRLEVSLGRMPRSDRESVDYSVLYDGQDPQAPEALVIFGGFSDKRPATPAEEIYRYLHPSSRATLLTKETAQPNSWGPLLRSGTVQAVLAAAGISMPVITIFSPIRPSKSEGKNLRNGDYSSFGELVEMVVATALDGEVRPTSAAPLKTTVHLLGLSLGAQEAVGAAAALYRSSTTLTLGSLTVQETVLGMNTLREANDYKILSGEPSTQTTEALQEIPEPKLRMLLDRGGGELLGMFTRMAGSAITGLSLLMGVTKSEQTKAIMEELVQANIPVTIARAANSKVSLESENVAPEKAQHVLIEAVAEKQLGHIVNEIHTAVAATAYYGLTFKAK